ncbi:MAG: hypothetical protein ACREMY_28685 [bacterium]
METPIFADLPILEFWRRHRHNNESIVCLNDGTRADGYTGRDRHRSDRLHVLLVFVLCARIWDEAEEPGVRDAVGR